MWKQPECLLTNERINKMWSISTVEYYPALIRKETLTHATKWMTPEDITWNADHKWMNIIELQIYEAPRGVKSINTESRPVAARGWGGGQGRGSGELVFNEERVSVVEDEKLLEIDGGVVA